MLDDPLWAQLRRWLERAVCVSALTVCTQVRAADLAIIMDDVGYNLTSGQRVLDLPAPITLAVIPFTAHAATLANLARHVGKEVILHQPLESERPHRVAEGTLTLGMARTDIQSGVRRALASLPGCIGVSNHTGSRFTQHPGAMGALMEVVRLRGLFYVDSRTTPNTVADGVAARFGVPFIERDVFLDHDPSPRAIARAFAKALAIAERNGHAVAIAHPHRTTLAFLEAALPEAAGQVRLVPLSRLARRQATPSAANLRPPRTFATDFFGSEPSVDISGL